MPPTQADNDAHPNRGPVTDGSDPPSPPPPPIVFLALPLHAWRPAPATFARLRAALPAAERARADAYRRDEDRRRAVAGQYMLRLVLRACVPSVVMAAPQLDIVRTPEGKPVLTPAPGTNFPAAVFNLSHDGAWVIAAGAATSTNDLASTPHPQPSPSAPLAIGIDVAAVHPTPAPTSPSAFLAAFRAHLHPTREWPAIFAATVGTSDQDGPGGLSPPLPPLRAFFRVWCAKEAVLKALGVGIAAGAAEVGARGPRLCDVVVDIDHAACDAAEAAMTAAAGAVPTPSANPASPPLPWSTTRAAVSIRDVPRPDLLVLVGTFDAEHAYAVAAVFAAAAAADAAAAAWYPPRVRVIVGFDDEEALEALAAGEKGKEAEAEALG
ncbi:hypothetical protein HK405_011978 [Cladochytrium tenue]|nr:hypothetical protein HK405_011978 [Cladochytrium tenue]